MFKSVWLWCELMVTSLKQILVKNVFRLKTNIASSEMRSFPNYLTECEYSQEYSLL